MRCGHDSNLLKERARVVNRIAEGEERVRRDRHTLFHEHVRTVKFYVWARYVDTQFHSAGSTKYFLLPAGPRKRRKRSGG